MRKIDFGILAGLMFLMLVGYVSASNDITIGINLVDTELRAGDSSYFDVYVNSSYEIVKTTYGLNINNFDKINITSAEILYNEFWEDYLIDGFSRVYGDERLNNNGILLLDRSKGPSGSGNMARYNFTVNSDASVEEVVDFNFYGSYVKFEDVDGNDYYRGPTEPFRVLIGNEPSFTILPKEISCQPGNYSVTGNEPCTPCVAGTFSNVEGALLCEVCMVGYFSNPGSVFCTACAENYCAPLPGSAVCLACLEGTYAPVGAGECSSLCGDGIVVGDEECDDGNTVDGDGCSSVCVIDFTIEGDVNLDCFVNVLDMIAVRNHLQDDVRVEDNWKYDINNECGDGFVNVLDMIAVRNKLGDSCQ